MMYAELGRADQEKILAEARERGYLTCYGNWFDVESAWVKECERADTPAVVLFLWHNQGDLYVDPVRPLKQHVVKALWRLFSSAAKRNKSKSFACTDIDIGVRARREDAIVLAKQTVMVIRNMAPVYRSEPDRRLPLSKFNEFYGKWRDGDERQ